MQNIRAIQTHCMWIALKFGTNILLIYNFYLKYFLFFNTRLFSYNIKYISTNVKKKLNQKMRNEIFEIDCSNLVKSV